jgi:hypothetical protein
MREADMPYSLPPTLLPDAVSALLSVLGLPVALPREPTRVQPTDLGGSETTWVADGGEVQLVQSHTLDHPASGGPPSMLDTLYVDYLHGHLSGLPGGGALWLRGTRSYGSSRVSGPDETAARIAAAWDEALWRLLTARSGWCTHASVRRAWDEAARSLDSPRAQRYLSPVGTVFHGRGGGRWSAVVLSGGLDNPHDPPTLSTLGPLPAGLKAHSFRSLAPVLPPLADLLPLLDPDAGPAEPAGRGDGEQQEGGAAGLLGGVARGWSRGREEWSAWRTGPWTLRESVVHDMSGPRSVQWTIQHEQGDPLALLARSVPSGAGRETYGSVIGITDETAAKVAAAAAALLGAAPSY